jgi:CheY-like chemotaxis protein
MGINSYFVTVRVCDPARHKRQKPAHSMKNTQEEPAAITAALQVEFAHLLGDQLDKIDFPASPMRAATLSTTFNVAKTQAYKLLKGMAFPSLSNFVTLRKMGVSMDEMLDRLVGQDQDLTDLYIKDQIVPSSIRYAKDETSSQVVVVPREGGSGFDLCVVGPGEKVPEGAKRIHGLTFSKRISLAIIEDNPVELEMLGKSTSENFRTGLFSTARSFFNESIAGYDIILLDWNLPDMKGPDVVKSIRSQSRAPIFILTGDDGATDAIIDVMTDKTVHHVSKPTNIKILIKRLTDAANELR